jgi:hypothetical protein
MSVKYLYLLGAAAVMGCATTAANTGTTRRANELSAAEIADAHADATTIYDAIARLRPNWLAPHGTVSTSNQGSEAASVFVDGQLMGDITALRNITAYQVGSVHYYNVAEAGARFGVRAGTTGAIEVVMKSASER